MITKINRNGGKKGVRGILLPLTSYLSPLISYLSPLIFLILLSCTPTPENVQKSSDLPSIYPDYCNVTIPENIAPLNFLLRADCEAIEVKAGELRINACGNEVVFDIDDWKGMLSQNAGREIEVTVSALINDQWIEYQPFRWQVVKDKIDPYLTYRLIEPDYEIWNNVQIQQRCVENFDVNAIGHYEQLENRCMNCHTFASQDPNLSMMYVRGPNGGAILNQNGRLSKLDIPGSVYFGFSPSGRYITYSTQKIIPAFHSMPSKRLEVFDATSNVYVADMQEHRVISSPLLSDSLKFETFPTFSPDGKYIYYCVADSVSLPRDIKNLLAEAGVELSQLDLLIYHQANKFMTDFFTKWLKFDKAKTPYSIRKFGNTSSASIPLTIVTELKSNYPERKNVILSGFGAGLSWGSVLLDLRKCEISELIEY